MRERMSAVDAAWFRMDRGASPADVVVQLVFREPPSFELVRRLVEERLLLAAPRFRQRAVHGSLLRGDAWETDPAFSLDHHLAHARPSNGRGLHEILDEIVTEPLDPARPPWRMHLVETPRLGALVLKVSHCVADGFALVGLLLAVSDEHLVPAESRHALPFHQRLASWLHPLDTARAALTDRARARELAGEIAAHASSLARFVALPFDRRSVLSAPLSGRRRTASSRGFPLNALRAAARAGGGTVNDVLVTAVAGALRTYLASEGEPVDDFDVHALVPVNLRPGLPGAGDGALGNRFGLAFLDLPTRRATRHERFAAVRHGVEVLKARPDAIVAFGLLGALGLAPAAVVPWALRFFTRKASVVVTSVPGPRQRLHVGGRAIEEAMFWVPHPAGLGVGISILSYAGEARIGVRADVAALPEPGRLVAFFEREVAALLEAAHADARAVHETRTGPGRADG
jgi:diacylglycerol O-acyltransferase